MHYYHRMFVLLYKTFWTYEIWFIRKSGLFDRLAFLICSESIQGIRLLPSLLVTALEALFTKLSSKFSWKLEILDQYLKLYSDYQNSTCKLQNFMSPRETYKNIYSWNNKYQCIHVVQKLKEDLCLI